MVFYVMMVVSLVGLGLLFAGLSLIGSGRPEYEERVEPKECRKEVDLDARFDSLDVRLLQVKADVEALGAVSEARLDRIEGLLLEIQQELRLV